MGQQISRSGSRNIVQHSAQSPQPSTVSVEPGHQPSAATAAPPTPAVPAGRRRPRLSIEVCPQAEQESVQTASRHPLAASFSASTRAISPTPPVATRVELLPDSIAEKRQSVGNAITALANQSGLTSAAFRAGLQRLLQNQPHVGIRFDEIADQEKGQVILNVLRTQTGLRSVLAEAPETPWVLATLIDTLTVVERNNPELQDVQLNVQRNELNHGHVLELRRLNKLTALDISMNQLGTKGAQEVSRIAGLCMLDISWNDIGSGGAASLQRLTGLKTLYARNNRISADGVQGLASLSGLKELDLSSNGFGRDGARLLSPLKSLVNLWLTRCDIEPEGVNGIASLKQLKELDVSGNYLDDRSVAALMSLPELAVLDISDNHLGRDAKHAMAGIPGLTSLKV